MLPLAQVDPSPLVRMLAPAVVVLIHADTVHACACDALTHDARACDAENHLERDAGSDGSGNANSDGISGASIANASQNRLSSRILRSALEWRYIRQAV